MASPRAEQGLEVEVDLIPHCGRQGQRLAVPFAGELRVVILPKDVPPGGKFYVRGGQAYANSIAHEEQPPVFHYDPYSPGFLNLRAGPGKKHEQVEKATKGTEVHVLETCENDDWLKVRMREDNPIENVGPARRPGASIAGTSHPELWALKRTVKADGTIRETLRAGRAPDVDWPRLLHYDPTSPTHLNLRNAPTMDSDVIGKLTAGQEVLALEGDSNWVRIIKRADAVHDAETGLPMACIRDDEMDGIWALRKSPKDGHMMLLPGPHLVEV